MKFDVLTQNLNQALNITNRSIATRTGLPILSNVLVVAKKGILELISTDLELSFRVRLGAKINEEGQITVPAKTLLELVASLDSGTLSVELVETTLKLQSGNAKASIQTVAADEYPVVPKMVEKPDLEIVSSRLLPALRVVSAASKDDSRPVFTGVLWHFEDKGLTLVATDGYRLSISTLSLDKSLTKEPLEDLIIPARALSELVRVVSKDKDEQIDFKIDREQQQVIFRVGEIELVTRLLGGDFPAYNQIVPTTSVVKVKITSNDLVQAVKRASIFARDTANIVKLKIADNQINVSANNNQLGNSETVIDAEVEGEPLEMAFNGRYVLDYLQICPEDHFVFESEGSLKPGVFKNESHGFLHIIMPVRVDQV